MVENAQLLELLNEFRGTCVVNENISLSFDDNSAKSQDSGDENNFNRKIVISGELKINRGQSNESSPIEKIIKYHYFIPEKDEERVTVEETTEFIIKNAKVSNLFREILGKCHKSTGYSGILSVESKPEQPLIEGKYKFIEKIGPLELTDPIIFSTTIEMDKGLLISPPPAINLKKLSINLESNNEYSDALDNNLRGHFFVKEGQINVEIKDTKGKCTSYLGRQIISDVFIYNKDNKMIEIIYEDKIKLDNVEGNKLYHQFLKQSLGFTKFEGNFCAGKELNECYNITRINKLNPIVNEDDIIILKKIKKTDPITARPF